MFNVNIVKCETEEVVESFEQLSRRSAEKLSRGISINLNHEEFYVDIIEKQIEQPKTPLGSVFPASRGVLHKLCQTSF